MCVCVCLWNFVTFVDLCDYHHQIQNCSNTTGLLCGVLKFVASIILYKWNSTDYNLLRLAFFTQHSFLEICPSCHAYQSFTLFLLLSGIPSYEHTIVCLTIHLLKGIWVVSDLEILRIKLLSSIVYRFLYRHKFPFFWDKCPWCNCLGHIVRAYLVLWKIVKQFSRMGVFPYILQRFNFI